MLHRHNRCWIGRCFHCFVVRFRNAVTRKKQATTLWLKALTSPEASFEWLRCNCSDRSTHRNNDDHLRNEHFDPIQKASVAEMQFKSTSDRIVWLEYSVTVLVTDVLPKKRSRTEQIYLIKAILSSDFSSLAFLFCEGVWILGVMNSNCFAPIGPQPAQKQWRNKKSQYGSVLA